VVRKSIWRRQAWTVSCWRSHVVGPDVIGCQISSDADDYRYARRSGKGVHMRRVDVPDEVADRARSLTADLGLALAGLDLRRRRDGTWCCLEVNPSPAFTFYRPVAGAIADFVAQALATGEG
jgi:glutathione synthase/RimK-type ligase-like ATP-grasp enzyme